MFVCCAKNCKCQHDSKAECIGCWLSDKFIHVNNTALKWSCESCHEAEADMSKFIRETTSLRKSFSKLRDEFQAAEMQFNVLKVLDVSPKPSLTHHKVVSPLSPCYTPIKVLTYQYLFFQLLKLMMMMPVHCQTLTHCCAIFA